jgi:hypothetical protein
MSEPPQTGTGIDQPGLPDDERSVHARARGLEAPTISGGEDPDPERGIREERFYIRLLLIMVALIVGLTIALTLIANYITATS